jgi:AcrR family transcriptional regulator
VRDAKRKLPAERHGELLAKAVDISADEGLSAVTLRRVGSALGVTPGLVSHYFSSAEQLITAAFTTSANDDLAEARSRVAAAVSPTAKVDALIDYVLDDSSEDASALWLEAWSLGRRNGALAAAANALTIEWLA